MSDSPRPISEMDILEIYHPVMKKILSYGECALTKEQYGAFRKLVLDGFGRNGAKSKLDVLFHMRAGRSGIAAKGRCRMIGEET